MLNRVYIHLGKKLHNLLLPFLYFGKGKRVRIVVLTRDRHILLLRNWFGYQNWSLPGGGIKKHETDKDAIVRELYEETGLSITPSRIKYLKSYPCYESSNHFEASVYYILLRKNLHELSNLQSLEVIEKKWYPLKKLPNDLGMPIAEILKEIEYKR